MGAYEFIITDYGDCFRIKFLHEDTTTTTLSDFKIHKETRKIILDAEYLYERIPCHLGYKYHICDNFNELNEHLCKFEELLENIK